VVVDPFGGKRNAGHEGEGGIETGKDKFTFNGTAVIRQHPARPVRQRGGDRVRIQLCCLWCS